MAGTIATDLAPDIMRWRHDTPGCSRVAHLNNAGAALAPSVVRKAIDEHLDLESEIGGYDTASLPEVPYGIQGRPVLGRVSRWVMRRATRLLANSEYSRSEAAANAGVDPARVTVVHHGVPDPFGQPSPAGRERMGLHGG